MAQTEPNLHLSANCKGGCGTATDLYSTSCGHMTLCIQCAKVLACIAAPCPYCGVCVTQLIKEYKMRAYKQSLEGGEEGTYYMFSMQGVEFRASPAPDWCPCRQVVQGFKKPLTLEEAAEHLHSGRRPIEGQETPTAAKFREYLTLRYHLKCKHKSRADASEDESESING